MSNKTEEKTEGKPAGLPAKTDDELKALAFEIFQGRVFTDRHCQNAQDISMVFMPLVFLDEASIEQLRKDDPGLIYEYMSEAGPRSCNGLPNFFSMKLLSQEDTAKVMKMCEEMKALKDQVSVGGGQQ